MNHDARPKGTAIECCGDLNLFFRETVGLVRQRRAYVTTTAAETYIAGLLTDHAHAPRIADAADEPLVLLLAKAMNAVGQERFRQLQHIGDGVLYTTGFFGEHLQKRGIERSYVEELGARAYATAGKMVFCDRADQ